MSSDILKAYVGQTSPLIWTFRVEGLAESGLPDVAHKPDVAPSSETPGGYVGQAVLESGS